MALSKYTKDTAVIANVGTKPEDRTDLTDETFKAKWDENATDWKTFFNNTASVEIDNLISTINTNFESNVRGTALTGLSTSDSSAIVGTDAVIGALGKSQAQITKSVNPKGVISNSNDAKNGGYLVLSTDLSPPFSTTWGTVFSLEGGTGATMQIALDASTTRMAFRHNNNLSWGSWIDVKPCGDATPLPATTGTITATMSASSIKTITPSGVCTFIAAGGTKGQTNTFVITTSGITSYTLTWGTGFKTTGTLATGAVSGKVFTVSFIFDGTNWVETARTAAM
jgi:hypothetical protein